MEEKKKNVPLIVALSVPLLMILLTAVSIYLPGLFVKPKINFIFSTDVGYCYQNRYSVKNGRVVENEFKDVNNNNLCPPNRAPRIFYYDVQRNTAKEMTFEEAQRFLLDDSLKSPDGFEVVPGNSGGDIFFFNGNSYYDKYLKKGAFSRRLNIVGASSYYYDFRFIGWVKEEGHG